MKLERTLVALRKSSDLNTVSSFLRKRMERPYLVVAFLNFPRDQTSELATHLDGLAIDRQTCAKILDGFDFELLPLDYEGDRLSASLFAENAKAENCDSVLVVSEGRKQVFAPDLASTLAVESQIPVIVIKP